MTIIAAPNLDRVLMKDATVLAMTGTGSGASAIGLLGQVKSVKFSIPIEYADVTASADGYVSLRAIRFGKGTLEIAGFSQLAGSRFAALMAQGNYANFQLTEAGSGDCWQFTCCAETYGKSMGKEATEDSLKFSIIGIPYFGAAGATPTALPLN